VTHRLIALLGSVILLASAPSGQGENRRWEMELELVGPLDSVLLDCAPLGETRIHADLLEGERRTLVVPVPAIAPLSEFPGAGSSASASEFEFPPKPGISAMGAGGTARFLRWLPRPQSGEKIGAEVGPRGRPPAPRAIARIRPGGIALVLGALVLALGLRRRAHIAWPAQILLAALALGSGMDSGESIPARVLEGGTWGWRVTESARGALPSGSGWLEVQPEGARVRFDITLNPLGGRVSAEDGSLVRISALEGPRPALDPASSGGPDLDRVWSRMSAGADFGGWRAHGPWFTGEGLPLPLPPGEAPDPPGWLLKGLKPGTYALLGHIAGEGGHSWVRIEGTPAAPNGAPGSRESR